MKKTIRMLSMVLALVLLCSAFTACSNISEDYASKVNKAAESDEHYTYTQVLEDLGEEAVDLTLVKTGVIIAVKDCKSIDDIKARLDEGQAVQGIIVTLVGGKAISAKYREISEQDLKK